MKTIEDVYTVHRKFQQWKDNTLRPVAETFAAFHVTPDAVSYAGVIGMVLFVLAVKSHTTLAALLLILCFFTDQFDGILARHLEQESDRGKFVDMVCDNFTFTLYMFGLIYAGLVSGLWGAVFIYFMITSKMMRSIYHAQFFQSDWKFKAIAGATPNIAAMVVFLLFFVFAIWDLNYLNTVSMICGIVLFVDTAIFFRRVWTG